MLTCSILSNMFFLSNVSKYKSNICYKVSSISLHFSFLQLKFNQDGKEKFALVSAKYFNCFASSPPFKTCFNKDPQKLAQELSCTLTQHLSSCSNADSTAEDTTCTTQSVDDSSEGHVASTSQAKTPVSTNQVSLKYKERLIFDSDVQMPKKEKKGGRPLTTCM